MITQRIQTSHPGRFLGSPSTRLPMPGWVPYLETCDMATGNDVVDLVGVIEGCKDTLINDLVVVAEGYRDGMVRLNRTLAALDPDGDIPVLEVKNLLTSTLQVYRLVGEDAIKAAKVFEKKVLDTPLVTR